jgi:serine/threonine-protein kinase RsbW
MPASDNQWTWQCDRVIPNDAGIGRQVLDDILCRLEGLHWNDHDIFGVHLAVYEALDNAISHGNARDAAKHVRFACRLSPTKIRVEITDEGPGFDPDALPDPTSPQRLGCPGGRGVLLMRAFMSHVEFQHGGNQVVLEKERRTAGG